MNSVILSKIENHKLWLDSQGKSGKRLSEDGIEFSNLELTKVNLSEANLPAAIFKICSN